ncbi:MAG TPA: hypothetical protein VE956_18900 [Nodularia sp. (in: cyanobacteria)]|nr:hypothetical protein [Nodularia sp. (in: cyanobacteria)]
MQTGRECQDREASIKQLRQEFNKLPGLASKLGMLPLAIASRAGNEILQPLARVSMKTY